MKIAKCTIWDGRIFYTDKIDVKSMRNFWARIKENYTREQLNQFKLGPMRAQIDLIEMTSEEYYSIPVVNEPFRVAKRSKNLSVNKEILPRRLADQNDKK